MDHDGATSIADMFRGVLSSGLAQNHLGKNTQIWCLIIMIPYFFPTVLVVLHHFVHHHLFLILIANFGVYPIVLDKPKSIYMCDRYMPF